MMFSHLKNLLMCITMYISMIIHSRVSWHYIYKCSPYLRINEWQCLIFPECYFQNDDCRAFKNEQEKIVWRNVHDWKLDFYVSISSQETVQCLFSVLCILYRMVSCCCFINIACLVIIACWSFAAPATASACNIQLLFPGYSDNDLTVDKGIETAGMEP